MEDVAQTEGPALGDEVELAALGHPIPQLLDDVHALHLGRHLHLCHRQERGEQDQGCQVPCHFFPCSSATSIFIASLTGMWARPASRSTQP